MTYPTAAWRAVFILLAFFMTGCFQGNRSSLDEEKDPHLLAARDREKSGKFEEAVESYERALQTNPKNATAHLELAVLYETRLGNHGSAIHHYQKHLEARPDSTRADWVNNKIQGCKRALAQSVQFVVGPPDFQREIMRLAETNKFLVEQIGQLRMQLAAKPAVITNFVASSQAAAPAYLPEEEDFAPPARFTSAPAARNSPRVENRPDSRGDSPRTASPPPPPTPSTTTPRGEWVPQTITPASRPSAQPAARGRIAHRLRQGETIASLARRYGVSISDITAANPGVNPNRVLVGQTIYIPAR